MIFVIVNKNNKVEFIHFKPFDKVDGLRKAKEELEKEGVLVENIPTPERIDGKQSTLYCNPVTKELWYEYENISKYQGELQEEINAKLIKDIATVEIELNKQRQLNVDLLLKIAQLGGNANV